MPRNACQSLGCSRFSAPLRSEPCTEKRRPGSPLMLSLHLHRFHWIRPLDFHDPFLSSQHDVSSLSPDDVCHAHHPTCTVSRFPLLLTQLIHLLLELLSAIVHVRQGLFVLSLLRLHGELCNGEGGYAEQASETDDRAGLHFGRGCFGSGGGCEGKGGRSAVKGGGIGRLYWEARGIGAGCLSRCACDGACSVERQGQRL